ncbi:MAG: hypothetical protein ACR2HI_07470 [Gaiella sp.]
MKRFYESCVAVVVAALAAVCVGVGTASAAPDTVYCLNGEAAGYSVSWGGKRAPDHDLKGVRGSGFNDIYPYFTK